MRVTEHESISKILFMSKFRIKAIVASRGLTIKGLAEKIGVTPQSISVIVNEKTSPNISTLEKIAEALDVPVASLFTDYLAPNPATIICPRCGARIDIKTATPR